MAIILGSPASGKTTLAQRLSAALRIPCLCKDEVKEALFEALGMGDREWSRRLSEASFAAIGRLAATQLAAGVSCIVEGNFRPEHAPALLAATACGAGAMQIRCLAGPEEIQRRFAGRVRHPGHLDHDLRAEIGAGPVPPFLELPGPRVDHASGQPDAESHIVTVVGGWLGGL